MSDTAQSHDYQKLISDVLQKQFTILGKQITLLRAQEVEELEITDDGHVTAIHGDPQEAITHLVAQFQELSFPLVEKTMQPLLHVENEPVVETSAPQEELTDVKPLPDLHAQPEPQPQQQPTHEEQTHHEQPQPMHEQGKEEPHAPQS
jgi:hypothetical protein